MKAPIEAFDVLRRGGEPIPREPRTSDLPVAVDRWWLPLLEQDAERQKRLEERIDALTAVLLPPESELTNA